MGRTWQIGERIKLFMRPAELIISSVSVILLSECLYPAFHESYLICQVRCLCMKSRGESVQDVEPELAESICKAPASVLLVLTAVGIPWRIGLIWGWERRHGVCHHGYMRMGGALICHTLNFEMGQIAGGVIGTTYKEVDHKVFWMRRAKIEAVVWKPRLHLPSVGIHAVRRRGQADRGNGWQESLGLGPEEHGLCAAEKRVQLKVPDPLHPGFP